jgi:hypothetical protein
MAQKAHKSTHFEASAPQSNPNLRPKEEVNLPKRVDGSISVSAAHHTRLRPDRDADYPRIAEPSATSLIQKVPVVPLK